MIISCVERRGREDVRQEKSEYSTTPKKFLANPTPNSGIEINHRVPLWAEIGRQ